MSNDHLVTKKNHMCTPIVEILNILPLSFFKCLQSLKEIILLHYKSCCYFCRLPKIWSFSRLRFSSLVPQENLQNFLQGVYCWKRFRVSFSPVLIAFACLFRGKFVGARVWGSLRSKIYCQKKDLYRVEKMLWISKLAVKKNYFVKNFLVDKKKLWSCCGHFCWCSRQAIVTRSTTEIFMTLLCKEVSRCRTLTRSLSLFNFNRRFTFTPRNMTPFM